MSVPFSSDCKMNHAVSDAIHSQLETMLHCKDQCQVLLLEVTNRGEIYSIRAKELTSSWGFLQMVPNMDKLRELEPIFTREPVSSVFPDAKVMERAEIQVSYRPSDTGPTELKIKNFKFLRMGKHTEEWEL
jgi:hypothetical protein